MATKHLARRDDGATESVDKWEIQLRKGCLDLAILGSLWPEKLYGLEILRRLEAAAGLALSAGTLYPLLARLKSDGLVTSEWVEAAAGHPRKYYQLTAEGRRRAVEMTSLWARFSASMETLLSPLLKEGPP